MWISALESNQQSKNYPGSTSWKIKFLNLKVFLIFKYNLLMGSGKEWTPSIPCWPRETVKRDWMEDSI